MKIAHGLCAALVALLACAAPAIAWEAFDSTEGGFTVQLPAEPDHQEFEVPTAIGTITAHMFLATDGDTEAAYYVAYNDFPEDNAPEDPVAALDGARDGMLANMGAELVSEEEVKVAEGLCREIIGSNDYDGEEVRIRVRIQLVDNRLYQFGVIAMATAEIEDDVETFLGSFELSQ